MFRLIRKPKPKQIDHVRLSNQVQMVQVLLDYGFNWDQINNALGFSNEWFNYSKWLLSRK